jgi:hypothetical protein
MRFAHEVQKMNAHKTGLSVRPRVSYWERIHESDEIWNERYATEEDSTLTFYFLQSAVTTRPMDELLRSEWH